MRLLPVMIMLGLLAARGAAQTPAPKAPKQEGPSATPGTADRTGADAANKRTTESARQPMTADVLNTRVGSIDLRRVPLEDAFARVADLGGANLVVRWRELEQIGIDPQEPVTFRGRNLTVSQMLWVLLNLVDTADARLAFMAEGNVILISSAEDFGRQMIIRVYDANHLLVNPIEDLAPYFSGGTSESLGNPPSEGGGEVAVARPQRAGLARNPKIRVSTYKAHGVRGARVTDINREMWELRMHRLVTMITATIAPESWSVNGGPGSILPYDGKLVVRNSARVHQQLAGPLTTPLPPTDRAAD